MANYYVNRTAQANGDHEVHKQGCTWLPNSQNRIDLGYQASDAAALRAARRYFTRVDGCRFCCPSIHRH